MNDIESFVHTAVSPYLIITCFLACASCDTWNILYGRVNFQMRLSQNYVFGLNTLYTGDTDMLHSFLEIKHSMQWPDFWPLHAMVKLVGHSLKHQRIAYFANIFQPFHGTLREYFHFYTQWPKQICC